MTKFLSVLVSLALLVALVPRATFAKTDVCALRNGCSCDCACAPGEGNSFKCEISKNCPCLGERKGIFYYPMSLLGKAWNFLSDDAAAMWNAFSQFTWYQNIFNVVALFFVGALMFRN